MHCQTIIATVVVVVCRGYGDGGVVAEDTVLDDVMVIVIVMFLNLFRAF